MPDLARLIAKQGSDLRLRQAIVTAAPSGGTCTIRFGDLASTTVADDIPGVHYLASASFANGDTVWVLQTGGALLIVGRVAGAADSWTPYTPSWLSSGTTPTIGNGFLSGRYTKIGRTVHGAIYHRMGSTTTFGTGAYVWTLPVAAQNALFDWQSMGTVKGYHAGSSLFAQLTLQAGTGGGQIRAAYSASAPAGGESTIGQATPWVWANGDDMTFHFTYEAAS